MRSCFILFVMSMFVACSLGSQAESMSSVQVCATDGVYQITFAAREEPFPGHAFVIWSSENNTDNICKAKSLGKVPTTSGGADTSKIVTLHEVSGEVRDEPPTEKMDYKLILSIDRQQYEKTLFFAKPFLPNDSSRKYQLFDNDCIEFSKSVAKLLNLKIPSRITNPTPAKFVKALTELNR